MCIRDSSIRISIVFGVTASVTGLYLSYFFNLPSGPTMSLVATGIFILAYVSNRLINKNTANLVPIEEER